MSSSYCLASNIDIRLCQYYFLCFDFSFFNNYVPSVRSVSSTEVCSPHQLTARPWRTMRRSLKTCVATWKPCSLMAWKPQTIVPELQATKGALFSLLWTTYFIKMLVYLFLSNYSECCKFFFNLFGWVQSQKCCHLPLCVSLNSSQFMPESKNQVFSSILGVPSTHC